MGEHKLDGLKAKELKANIMVAHNWITAVGSGTFHGHQSIHIATLLDFLQKEHDKAKDQFDALAPMAEFGHTSESVPTAMEAGR